MPCKVVGVNRVLTANSHSIEIVHIPFSMSIVRVTSTWSAGTARGAVQETMDCIVQTIMHAIAFALYNSAADLPAHSFQIVWHINSNFLAQSEVCSQNMEVRKEIAACVINMNSRML